MDLLLHPQTGVVTTEELLDRLNALESKNSMGAALQGGSAVTYDTNGRIATLNATYITAGTIDASQITVSNINANNISSGSLSANRISSGSITGAKIAANTIEAGNIKAGTITADEIAANTITAAKLNIASLSAITASLGDVTVGGSSNTYGTLTVKNSSGTEISKLNNSGIIMRNTRGLFFEEPTGGNYGSIQVNSSSQMVIQLPESANQFFIKGYDSGDDDWTLNLFTVSNTQTYSYRKIVADGGIECNDNTVYEVKMLNFAEHSSRPNDDDGIWYYKSGGSYGFRTRMEGGNWSIDQTGV